MEIQVAHAGTVYNLLVEEMFVGDDDVQYWIYDDSGNEVYRIAAGLDDNGMPGWKWIAYGGVRAKDERGKDIIIAPDQSFVNAIGEAIEKKSL